MVNQKPADLGIPIRFSLISSCFSAADELHLRRNTAMQIKTKENDFCACALAFPGDEA
jgi:hypothetical protein